MKSVFEKIIERLEEIYDNHGSSAESYKAALIKYFNKEAEEYGDGWIPCSERLPEENIEIDVTIEEIDGSRYTQTSWLQDGQWVIKKSPLEPTVIAWKERPAPYQPKGE